MDELAVELGMDPIELRRRNWIKAEEFPFTTVAGLVYDSGDYDAATDKALELFGYDELRAEQAAPPGRRATRCSSASASPPTRRCAAWRRRGSSARCGTRAGGWESASVRVLPTGKVEVVTGTSPHGQGHVTAWSQIVADELGVAVRGRRGAARRHPDLAQGPGHVRLAVARRRRGRARRGVPQGARQGPRRRRAHAGVQPRRPRVHRRRVPGAAARPDAVEDPGGHGVRGVRRARPARRRRGDARRGRHVRPADVLVPARHPPVRGRGRHADGPRQHPQLRRRRRRRQGRQPAHRRGAGARRRRAGHRAGAATRRRCTTSPAPC